MARVALSYSLGSLVKRRINVPSEWKAPLPHRTSSNISLTRRRETPARREYVVEYNANRRYPGVYIGTMLAGSILAGTIPAGTMEM